MKNFFLIFSFLFLLSCSKDDDKNTTSVVTDGGGTVVQSTVLPKKINVESKYAPYTLIFDYDGKKIKQCVVVGYNKEVYTYDGDNIVRKEVLLTDNTLLNKHEYKYINNKLEYYLAVIYNTPSGNITNKTVFTYNADNSISYVTYRVKYNGDLDPLCNGKLFFLNENLIRHEINDGSSTRTLEYSYDDKNNPFKNILGFDKLLSFEDSDYVSKNNIVEYKSTFKSNYNNITDVKKYTYKYDLNGYPVEKKSDSSDSKKYIFSY
ncbi:MULTISPECIES: hypothetical protein [Flavobacterium]|uniref:hypothetical protein n=1 Tax=Flavobacterium TaxID=237 RepID=UPI00107EA293|nr:hypothetical protein [Flavobacterium columnare]MCH4831909.1 hypothetical protein [Flavobacterium columnare]